MGVPTATVIMRGPDGISRTASCIGTGPVDATYKVRAQGAVLRVAVGLPCFGRSPPGPSLVL